MGHVIRSSRVSPRFSAGEEPGYEANINCMTPKAHMYAYRKVWHTSGKFYLAIDRKAIPTITSLVSLHNSYTAVIWEITNDKNGWWPSGTKSVLCNLAWPRTVSELVEAMVCVWINSGKLYFSFQYANQHKIFSYKKTNHLLRWFIVLYLVK